MDKVKLVSDEGHLRPKYFACFILKIYSFLWLTPSFKKSALIAVTMPVFSRRKYGKSQTPAGLSVLRAKIWKGNFLNRTRIITAEGKSSVFGFRIANNVYTSSGTTCLPRAEDRYFVTKYKSFYLFITRLFLDTKSL